MSQHFPGIPRKIMEKHVTGYSVSSGKFEFRASTVLSRGATRILVALGTIVFTCQSCKYCF
jgi:hypothetical protein